MLSDKVCCGLNHIKRLPDFYRVNSLQDMAWAAYVLRRVVDVTDVFPQDKWATIQEIERQLSLAALDVANQINNDLSEGGE